MKIVKMFKITIVQMLTINIINLYLDKYTA